MVVPLVELLEPLAEEGHGHKIDAGRVLEYVVQPLIGTGGRLANVGQQRGQFFSGHVQRAGKLGAVPGLRLGVSPFPAHDGGAVDADEFGKALLAEAHRLAALRQAVPFAGHERFLPWAVLLNIRIYSSRPGRATQRGCIFSAPLPIC